MPVPITATPNGRDAGGEAEWDDIFAAFRLSEHFLTRDVLVDRAADTLAARARLVDRLRRAVA